MTDEQTIEAPEAGPGNWADDLNDYIAKKPSASDAELFKQFPQLNGDSKRIDAAVSYGQAKAGGMSDDQMAKLYPDLIAPKGPYIDPKNAKTGLDDQTPTPKINPLDPSKFTQTNAAESTAGGSTKIKRDIDSAKATAVYNAHIEAKYKPMLDKIMGDIDADKSHFVDNQRPALDSHPDAPDSFYEVPKMEAIDAYLKSTVQDPSDRYYLRNRIIAQFQQNKDNYNVSQIAQKKIAQLPAMQKALQEANIPENLGKAQDPNDIFKRAQAIDPNTKNQVNAAYAAAAKSNEDIKNETARAMINNSTSLSYDQDGNLKKVNTLDPNAPFHDQITGGGKAWNGFWKFASQVGQMSSGVLQAFGAKEPGYSLQKMSDDVMKQSTGPGGDQGLGEFLGGEALPMILQGEAMGNLSRTIGAPIFAGLNGAAAKGMIGKLSEGALGGLALAPINSALIAHDYYTSLVKAGETPEIAHAKAENVFDKNLITDMAISPVQFGIMNAPVSGAIAKGLLRYGASPVIAGTHFMAQDFFQQKENNPALTAWDYATSKEGLQTGLSGALTGIVQHYAIGKMNDWQNEKNLKDAFSFGRAGQTPETSNLPNNNVIANTVLNGFEMKDGPNRPQELKGLIDDLHKKGVYNPDEAKKISGIIDDVAAVKDMVPKMGTSAQRMAVFNELLNQQEYNRQIPLATIPAMQEAFETKIKDSNTRIQDIMNGTEPLYFVNGNETSKDQLTRFVEDNPGLLKGKALNIDVIGDDKTDQAIKEARQAAIDNTKITEVRHAVTDEDNKGVTSGPTTVPLNDEGQAQAEKLGSAVKGMDIDRVLSSDLPRSVKTADIVADKIGAPRETIPEIKSWDIGEFDKTKDKNFKQVEKYFVEHPDEKEYQGKKIGETFNEYTGRVIEARQKIDDENDGHALLVNHGGNINVWDAYEKNGKVWNDQAAKDYLNAKDLEPAQLRETPDEDVKEKPLPGRSSEFSDFYHKFKGEIADVPDISFDSRISMPLDQKSREGAVKDIDKGKDTKRAKLFLDELQRQYDSGTLEYTRGRGNHVETHGISVQDFNRIHEEAAQEVVEQIKGGWEPQEGLAKLFLEEAHKNDENESREITGSETGRSTPERESGTAEDKRVSPVRAGDEAEAGDRSTPEQDDAQPVANRAPGFVRASGSPEDAAADEDEPGTTQAPQGDLSTPSLQESYVRENINSQKDSSLTKRLTENGLSDQEAADLISKVKAEQNMSPEDIIREAMAIGKTAGKSKQTAIFDPKEGKAMEPGLLKTLRRWYFDGKDDVSDVKSIIRKNKGTEEFNIDKIYHETRKLVNFWNSVPKIKQMAFMLGVEKPELLAGQPRQTKDLATAYRARLDKTFEIIGKAMPDLNYIEDYFPHFWDKPEQARNFFANTLSKAPLEGSKTFAKKRFFETIVAGLKEGYKLSTTNPEEIVRLAEANAWKFKTAHDIFSDMKDQGYLKYSMNAEKPEGWKTVSDPLFTKMAATVDKNGNADLVKGAYYMPPDVAKLINGYLSLGIKSPIKTFIQQYNNIKNLFQLGVGFFHVGTTSLDAMVSGMTNGIQKLTAGNPRGLIDLATLGNLPATLMRGFKAKGDWNKGIVTQDVQALMDANAKVGRQKMYSLDTAYNMKKAFGQLRADADFKQIPKLLWNTMLYLPEAINKPLMEQWVPALKVGGYLRALDSEISSRKNMTPAELQTAKQKIWDSMDDRLGQVVYDNVFMNKTLKDAAFMCIRSAGWTGGTIRAVSGGLAEIPRSGQRLAQGQGLSQRTAYLAALPLTVAIMGAFYHRLMTGQNPDELKDYFFPKDGTTNPDGTDHRVALPSYMKDILAYSKTPFKTLAHKTAPFLNETIELYANKDFYGEKIYNNDDPMYQRGLDALKYEAQSMEPFSFKKKPGDESPFSDQFTTAQGIEQKFGIMPAPRERERTELQNKISQAYQDQIGTKEEGTTHEQMEQNIARRHLREFIHDGGDYKDASQEWKDAAGLKPQALGKFIHESKLDPYERYYKALTSDTKIKLLKTMSDEDKEKYEKYIPVADRGKINDE